MKYRDLQDMFSYNMIFIQYYRRTYEIQQKQRRQNRAACKEMYGGWESPACHIRGTFAGHFLSAAAFLGRDGGYPVLRAKAEYMTEEIRRCQERNGGLWAFPIPEKYLLSQGGKTVLGGILRDDRGRKASGADAWAGTPSAAWKSMTQPSVLPVGPPLTAI